MPQRMAGLTILPSVSLPMAKATSPAAMAAPGPALEPGDGEAQPRFQSDLWFPAHCLPGQGDVGLPDLRIVLGPFDEVDRCRGAGQPPDRLRQLEYRYLVRIADVHGTGMI